MRPIKGGKITFPYGVRGSMWQAGFHPGDDWATPVGTPVRAIIGGRVEFAGTTGGWGADYGIHVVLRHPLRRRQCGYMHLSGTRVHAGQWVRRGQVLGMSGQTGHVTGPHVHIEQRISPFRYDNRFRKPRYYV